MVLGFLAACNSFRDCSRRSNRLGHVGGLRDYIPSFSSVKMGDEWGSLALEWHRRDKI
jgi:hypothetical protein